MGRGGFPGRALPLLAALAALLLPSALPLAEEAQAHHHAGLIQPGAQMVVPYFCTMNFIFEDATGALFIGTAGHCTDRLGQNVRIAGVAGVVGQVVWRSMDPDFALVTIQPQHHDLVSPAVRHWGGPTGVAAQAEAHIPDLAYHYGYGTGFEYSEWLRARAAVLVKHRPQEFVMDGFLLPGDSGSPVILAGGEALGVESEAAFDEGASDRGPTLEYIFRAMRDRSGIELRLVTAPLADPAARELARVTHPPFG